MSDHEPVKRFIGNRRYSTREEKMVLATDFETAEQRIAELEAGLELEVERACDNGEANDDLREERDTALASLAATDEEIAEQAETIERLRGLLIQLRFKVRPQNSGRLDFDLKPHMIMDRDELFLRDIDAALKEK